MVTWILIMALQGSWASEGDFSALQTHEFNNKEACEVAQQAYKEEFNTAKNYTAKAICVAKQL